jgi:hypothetical protein
MDLLGFMAFSRQVLFGGLHKSSGAYMAFLMLSYQPETYPECSRDRFRHFSGDNSIIQGNVRCGC